LFTGTIDRLKFRMGYRRHGLCRAYSNKC